MTPEKEAKAALLKRAGFLANDSEVFIERREPPEEAHLAWIMYWAVRGQTPPENPVSVTDMIAIINSRGVSNKNAVLWTLNLMMAADAEYRSWRNNSRNESVA